MHLKKYLAALLLASATVSALPTADGYDYGSGTEYKRSADLDAICARGDQSGSCLRRRKELELQRKADLDAICARADQSGSCLRRRKELELQRKADLDAVCARNDQSASCLRKRVEAEQGY